MYGSSMSGSVTWRDVERRFARRRNVRSRPLWRGKRLPGVKPRHNGRRMRVGEGMKIAGQEPGTT
jgi:hypothetical protein